MKPISIRRWLLAGVLGATVAVGCRGVEPDLSLATPPLPDAPAPDVSKASAEATEAASSDEKTSATKQEPLSSEKTAPKPEPEVKAAEVQYDNIEHQTPATIIEELRKIEADIAAELCELEALVQ